eukprot:1835487-Pyramimonas_sp.AAC.1
MFDMSRVGKENVTANVDSQDSPASKVSSSSAGSLDPQKALDQYLYDYKPGMTVFHRFTQIKPPGGIKMVKQLKDSYGVPGKQGISCPWFDPAPGIQPNCCPSFPVAPIVFARGGSGPVAPSFAGSAL